METVLLSSLDLWIIILYLLGVTSLGLWVSRGIRSSKDFFLAGRSLPWWMAGMSMVVSDIGAKDMIGLAGDAYRYGIVMMNFEFSETLVQNAHLDYAQNGHSFLDHNTK